MLGPNYNEIIILMESNSVESLLSFWSFVPVGYILFKYSVSPEKLINDSMVGPVRITALVTYILSGAMIKMSLRFCI
jgi:hypothetical protein